MHMQINFFFDINGIDFRFSESSRVFTVHAGLLCVRYTLPSRRASLCITGNIELPSARCRNPVAFFIKVPNKAVRTKRSPVPALPAKQPDYPTRFHHHDRKADLTATEEIKDVLADSVLQQCWIKYQVYFHSFDLLLLLWLP